MNDSLVFVYFDPNMGISLPRYSSRFYEAAWFLIHIVAPLCSRDIVSNICVQPFLSPSHRLIVEFARLFLKLVITDIESISPKTVIAHPNLILLTIQMINHLIIVLVVIVNTSVVVGLLQVVPSWWLHNIQTIISLVLTISVGSVILVSVYLILLLLPTPTIIIEHRVLSSAGVIVHLYLSRVLKRQILLALAIILRVYSRLGSNLVLKVYLLLVVVLRFRTVS